MTVKKWIVIVLLCAIITACNRPLETIALPISNPGQSQTWIDAPLPNSTIPMLPYKLVFHGASTAGINEFEIRINGGLITTVPPVSTESIGTNNGTLFLGEFLWTPPAPGTYLIEVRAIGSGQDSTPHQVQVTVIGEDVELETPLATEPTPTLEPTPTATLQESRECTYLAVADLFCRLGPGKEYPEIGFFFPGQSAPIVGKTTDGIYWYVIGPNTGRVCTVPNDIEFGIVEGDCDVKPVFTPVPIPTSTPTPKPIPTFLPTPVPGCTVRQAGGAIICVSPCPAGAAPGEACTP